jgi:hypothetical protein
VCYKISYLHDPTHLLDLKREEISSFFIWNQWKLREIKGSQRVLYVQNANNDKILNNWQLLCDSLHISFTTIYKAHTTIFEFDWTLSIWKESTTQCSLKAEWMLIWSLKTVFCVYCWLLKQTVVWRGSHVTNNHSRVSTLMTNCKKCCPFQTLWLFSFLKQNIFAIHCVQYFPDLSSKSMRKNGKECLDPIHRVCLQMWSHKRVHYSLQL